MLQQMGPESYYDAVYKTISDFYWEHDTTWLSVGLAVVLWVIVIVIYRQSKLTLDNLDDSHKSMIVVVPAREKLLFPEFCAGCGQPTEPKSFIKVIAAIGAGSVEVALNTLPGSVISHVIRWNLPSCSTCATNAPQPLAPTLISDLLSYPMLLAWVLFIVLSFYLVIGAGGFFQLVWLIPAGLILLGVFMVPIALLEGGLSYVWSRFRGRKDNPFVFKDTRHSVYFSIDRVDQLPLGMWGGRPSPWGPHVYRFVFSRHDYANRFNELNGGISALYDKSGQREIAKRFQRPNRGSGLDAFASAFAYTFVIILVLAILIALIFRAYRIDELFSKMGLLIIFLLSACLALGFTIGPDTPPASDHQDKP